MGRLDGQIIFNIWTFTTIKNDQQQFFFAKCQNKLPKGFKNYPNLLRTSCTYPKISTITLSHHFCINPVWTRQEENLSSVSNPASNLYVKPSTANASPMIVNYNANVLLVRHQHRNLQSQTICKIGNRFNKKSFAGLVPGNSDPAVLKKQSHSVKQSKLCST